MIYLGRATGNQHLESKGMAIQSESENDLGRRAGKTGKMPKS
ncbi:hypothetical protein [Spongiactinospora gelatinilytica]|nr:hypothetical protein [Spongiactinospora gelatinilytica]